VNFATLQKKATQAGQERRVAGPLTIAALPVPRPADPRAKTGPRVRVLLAEPLANDPAGDPALGQPHTAVDLDVQTGACLAVATMTGADRKASDGPRRSAARRSLTGVEGLALELTFDAVAARTYHLFWQGTSPGDATEGLAQDFLVLFQVFAEPALLGWYPRAAPEFFSWLGQDTRVRIPLPPQ
jgi:hypothetical protein